MRLGLQGCSGSGKSFSALQPPTLFSHQLPTVERLQFVLPVVHLVPTVEMQNWFIDIFSTPVHSSRLPIHADYPGRYW